MVNYHIGEFVDGKFMTMITEIGVEVMTQDFLDILFENDLSLCLFLRAVFLIVGGLEL